MNQFEVGQEQYHQRSPDRTRSSLKYLKNRIKKNDQIQVDRAQMEIIKKEARYRNQLEKLKE